jgi:hypothetical protein
MMSYAMKKRIEHINNKKMNGNDKSKLLNNQMFRKFIINTYKNKSHQQNQINLESSNNMMNNLMCNYALKINGIINDLHGVVENTLPIINTPDHPFTKMNIESYLMIGTSIQPYVYEIEPIINIDNNNNIVYGVWSNMIDIGGFIDNNINEIYNLVIKNNSYNYRENDDGTIEVEMNILEYEHINGSVKFIQSMVINPKKNLMTFVKTWTIVLN